MDELLKLELLMSDIRRDLAGLAGEAEPTPEQLAQMDELRQEYMRLETRANALRVAGSEPAEPEPEPEPETRSDDRQYLELVQRANLGVIADGVLAQRSMNGAEQELQRELGLNDNQVPLDMLETRAVTPAPGQVTENQAPILPIVFPEAASSFLSVGQPRVPVGHRNYPYLSTGASVKTPAESASAAETTGAFTVKSLSPSRLQASFFWTREDAASFAGMEASLRDNLRMALSDALDIQVLAKLLSEGTAQSEITTKPPVYATFEGSIYNAVDGIYASMASQVRCLLALDTYKAAAKAYRANESDMTALGAMQAISGGVMTTPASHLPAVASKKQKSIYRLGSRMDAVAPIWEGITLIPDEITKADTGEIVLTAVMLYGAGVIRKQGFKVVEFQLTA